MNRSLAQRPAQLIEGYNMLMLCSLTNCLAGYCVLGHDAEGPLSEKSGIEDAPESRFLGNFE